MTNIKVVIGANFGDEGKGLMTDYFSHQALSNKEDCVVVLANGGAQRGHTVTDSNGAQHVFHHFGAGSLAGASTYCTSEYILNPMTYVKEYFDLIRLGYTPTPVYIEYACRWSTPFDMIANQIIEASREDKKHGSCGMGIWETVVRYERRPKSPSLFMFNVMAREHKQAYLKELRDVYLPNRLKEEGIASIPAEWSEIVNSDVLIEHFIDDVAFMVNHAQLSTKKPLNTFKNIVFENGQGLLLDQNQTFYGNNTTPSATGSFNAVKSINQYFYNTTDEVNVEMCYVTRTYMTRHGAGRFETECAKSLINEKMFDETNVTNKFQDNLRYGKLILPNLVTRVSSDFAQALANNQNKSKIKLTANIAVTHTNEYEIDYARLRDQLISGVYVSDSRTRDSVKVFTDF